MLEREDPLAAVSPAPGRTNSGLKPATRPQHLQAGGDGACERMPPPPPLSPFWCQLLRQLCDACACEGRTRMTRGSMPACSKNTCHSAVRRSVLSGRCLRHCCLLHPPTSSSFAGVHCRCTGCDLGEFVNVGHIAWRSRKSSLDVEERWQRRQNLQKQPLERDV